MISDEEGEMKEGSKTCGWSYDPYGRKGFCEISLNSPQLPEVVE